MVSIQRCIGLAVAKLKAKDIAEKFWETTKKSSTLKTVIAKYEDLTSSFA